MTAAYQKMVNLKPSLASYNRASYVRWLYGDLRNATRYMLMAIRAGSTQPENVAWCQSQLGDDYFNAGFVLPARYEYRAALTSFPHYARALAGMAAVEIALGHRRAAVRYYQQAIEVVPLPQYVIGLGDLYASMGNRAAAEKEYALISFMNHIFTINHVQFGPEMAQFDADHNRNLAQALRLARAAAGYRHDIQTMDTLAWVLYKNGRYPQAWNAEEQALRLGTRFAPYFFHAGMIQAAEGHVTEAQSYLSSALMLNLNFGVLQVPVARAELTKLNALSTSSAAKKK
jgi:tetratricopeptide (TPR) repeat protein